MTSPHPAVPSLPLRPGASFGPQTKPLKLVRADSPAVSVMTDFTMVVPVTTDPEIPIELALAKMKTAAVRLLFVVDEMDRIIGLITARDIMGTRPIKVTEMSRKPRAEITVSEIMTPQADVQVLDAARVEQATVNEIIATLNASGRQHALVAKIDPDSGEQQITGMFSTSRIGKLLGHDVASSAPPADSLAEIIAKMT